MTAVHNKVENSLTQKNWPTTDPEWWLEQCFCVAKDIILYSSSNLLPRKAIWPTNTQPCKGL